MVVPIQVTYRDFARSDAIDARIKERAARLERHHKRITDCRVVIEAPHRHHRHGKLYHVRIDLVVPGGELVVNHDSHDKHAHEDVYVAIRDAFNAMERQLQGFARQRGGETKTHDTPAHGKVTRMFPDYGFIRDSDGNEIYFHCNSVLNDGFEGLDIGSEVRFVTVEGESEKGPQATTVRPIGKHHLDQRIMEIMVECSTGDKGDATPERIYLGRRSIAVVDVIDRWLSPDHDHFKVIGDDGATYIVRHDGNTGVWELEFFEADRAS